jgi:hypothetical protein
VREGKNILSSRSGRGVELNVVGWAYVSSSLHLTTTLIDIVREVRTNYGTLPYLLHPPPI